MSVSYGGTVPGPGPRNKGKVAQSNGTARQRRTENLFGDRLKKELRPAGGSLVRSGKILP